MAVSVHRTMQECVTAAFFLFPESQLILQSVFTGQCRSV
ncbi:hypothetical protein O5759_09875 [Escherichia coli]|nr:hypothetical protein [Escherichia coli]